MNLSSNVINSCQTKKNCSPMLSDSQQAIKVLTTISMVSGLKDRKQK